MTEGFGLPHEGSNGWITYAARRRLKEDLDA